MVQNSWTFLAREVTLSCCTYRAHNVTLYGQVTLRDSPYTMADATTMPPQIVEEDYQGPPEIDEVEVTFSEDGFPDLQVTETPDTSTVQLMERIQQPAAQKMEIAIKKVNHWPVSSKKAVSEGDSAAECLARQSINLIKHQATAIQSTRPPVTTTQPSLVICPC